VCSSDLFVEIPTAFTTLSLGRINEAANINTANEASATIKWFEKVLIGVNLSTNTKVYSYNQIGETQLINLLSVIN
jgi:hypothetical protein